MFFALLMLSGCNEKKSEPANIPVQSLTLSKTSYVFTEIGETLQLEATVLPENATNPTVTWKSSNATVVTVSDNGLVTSVGEGIATIIAIADKIVEMCEVSVSVEDDRVKDICGNKYKYITIGSQVWMAENMRCDKYDTQSGRTGATLSTSSDRTYAPYYTNASDKSLWNSDSQEHGVNLTLVQIDKLGYLYNWAAAVGVATAEEAKAQNSEFSTNRQGICPNGWHVPTRAEWDALGVALGGTKESNGNFPNVGKLLKTISGWYYSGNDNGTDAYSFSALPSGYASGSAVNGVGRVADFWTATPSNSTYTFERSLSCSADFLNHGFFSKDYALSVRCVRNQRYYIQDCT